MAAEPIRYTRLTRNASSIGTYSSLWLGDDHLMIVTSSGFSEDYVRVEFRDVKGFFVTKSERRMWWRLVWAMPVVLCLILAVVVESDGQAPIVSLIFLALFSGAVVWNEALGPTCHAFVVTGVQTAKLPSLVRLKKTRQVLGRLQPLIEAAQADLVVAPPPVVVGETPPVIAPPPPLQ